MYKLLFLCFYVLHKHKQQQQQQQQQSDGQVLSVKWCSGVIGQESAGAGLEMHGRRSTERVGHQVSRRAQLLFAWQSKRVSGSSLEHTRGT
jgi:hypothetical protein